METEEQVGLMIDGCGEAGKQESSRSPWFLACTASYCDDIGTWEEDKEKLKNEFLALLTGFAHKLVEGIQQVLGYVGLRLN